MQEWLSGWDKRVKITIDHNDVDSALSDFPVLVYLSNSSGRNNEDVSFVFDELQSDANRKKIAVTTSDGATQCYVEIERWDDASEQAWLWVKVPNISNTSSTYLYLYYDADHAENTDYVGDSGSRTKVWDNNFTMVQHLQETPQGTVYDSTSNNIDSTYNSADPTTLGQIDGAYNFTPNDYINVGAISGNQGTVSSWFRLDSLAYQVLVAEGVNSTNTPFLFIAPSGWGAAGYFEIRAYVGSANGVRTTGQLQTGRWYYGCAWSNGSTWKIFIDGVEQTITTTYGSNTGQWFDDVAGNIWSIGVLDRPTDWGYFNGVIDEVRISNIARSAAWIKASYESGRDNLLSFGSEETA